MTEIYNDPIHGTKITFHGDEVRLVVASPPFSKHTVQMDEVEVEALLAVREHAADPVPDIAEHFSFVHHVHHATRAAEAFVAAAGGIAACKWPESY